MAYQESTYKGDSVYSIDCAGDCVVGDKVCFERAVFSGSFRSAKLEGFERVEGEISSDSYGAVKQQHTFTITLQNGEKLRIKGRNLYRNGVFRRPWDDEAERKKALVEKHSRGDSARDARDARRELDIFSL